MWQQGPFFIRLKDNPLAKFAENHKKPPLKEFFSSLKGDSELYIENHWKFHIVNRPTAEVKN